MAVNQCWSDRTTGPSAQTARTFAFWLTFPVGLQVALDATSPGVAGFGHLAGCLAAFALAALYPRFRPDCATLRDESHRKEDLSALPETAPARRRPAGRPWARSPSSASSCL